LSTGKPLVTSYTTISIRPGLTFVTAFAVSQLVILFSAHLTNCLSQITSVVHAFRSWYRDKLSSGRWLQLQAPCIQ